MGTPSYVNGLIAKWKGLPDRALATISAPVDAANSLVHRLTNDYLPGLSPSPAQPVPTYQSPPRNWDAFVQADAANRATQQDAPMARVVRGALTKKK